MKRIAHCQRGVTALEYGLIASLVAVGLVGILGVIGFGLDEVFYKLIICLDAGTCG